MVDRTRFDSRKEWFDIVIVYDQVEGVTRLPDEKVARVKSRGLAYRVARDFENVYKIKQHIEIR